MWARYILRVPRSKKIAFTYLANDLIQRIFIKATKKKHKEMKNPPAHWSFYKVFGPPIISEVLTKMLEILNQTFKQSEDSLQALDKRHLANKTNEINQSIL